MKRLIFLIWSLIYLSTSTGANVHLHYCMGQIASWGLWQKDDKECDKCGMKKDGMKDGCCNDEYQYVKLKVDQKPLEKITSDFFPFLIYNTTHYNIDFSPILNSINYPTRLNNSTLRSWRVPLYLRNCLFLI